VGACARLSPPLFPAAPPPLSSLRSLQGKFLCLFKAIRKKKALVLKELGGTLVAHQILCAK
jgi:hypothetical protein